MKQRNIYTTRLLIFTIEKVILNKIRNTDWSILEQYRLSQQKVKITGFQILDIWSCSMTDVDLSTISTSNASSTSSTEVQYKFILFLLSNHRPEKIKQHHFLEVRSRRAYCHISLLHMPLIYKITHQRNHKYPLNDFRNCAYIFC